VVLAHCVLAHCVLAHCVLAHCVLAHCVLAHCAHISSDDAIVAVRAQASLRDIVLPGRFDIPDLDHWNRPYPIEARKARGLAEQTLGDAVTAVSSCVDPILAGTATGAWDPVTLRWRCRS
jgi:hypothetical protein